MTEHHVSTFSLEKLLVMAIDLGNVAARHEIGRRKIAANKSLAGYILDELSGVAVDIASDSDGSGLPRGIYECAKRFVAEGYLGQNMREHDKAAMYIRLAADNPNVEDELPESGFGFWKSARFHYRVWLMEKGKKR
jgi:hypothetical protein